MPATRAPRPRPRLGALFPGKRRRRRRGAQDRGFTLMEILVVLAIIGILVSIATGVYVSRVDDARMTRARADIQAIEAALDIFRLDNFRYPSNAEGLQALAERPNDPDLRWPQGGYMRRLPMDPWNRPYLYSNPGRNGEVDIYTLGRDGQAGGEEQDQDIGNWNLDQQP
ncbi:MAG: type II secretion system major pseudopilin GspG [Gammaproteobacteria bacterium]|nr:type II secretion system major pseudopilin GspG [Gammaproteobacteria bacterium]MCY4340189.1 type II secretion system major pseudopilin GspG [Gammaproteobacteria bacterium]